MAAGNVTISTFLELRDNLSGGIKSVESQINRLTQAAQQAEDAIKRMKQAQAARPPKPPPPPKPPGMPGGRGGPGAPREDPFLKFQGGIFSSVVRANLLVDAIEGAIMGATSAIAGLLKYTVKVSEEYENAQLNITNTLTSMAVSPSIETGQRKAIALMTQMRELAAKLPGEAKDYINAFSLTLPEALAAGEKDVKRYAKFVSMYTATALSKGVDAPQAARDLVEMLQGRAHLRTATFQKLRTQIGMLAKDFNRLDPEQRYARVTAAVDKAGAGLAMASDTASAKFGELKSRIDEIFIMGGQPFFESVKSAVTDINHWLERNKVVILDITKSVALGLGDAFGGVLLTVKEIADYIVKIKGGTAAATTRSERLRELEDPYRKRSTAQALTSLIPGVGLMSAFQDIGEIARLNKEIESEYQAFMKQQATIASHAGAAAIVKPKGYTPSIMEQTIAESQLKAMAPIKGVQSMFENQEKWAEFVEARGYDAGKLWDDLLREGKVTPPIAPTTTREVNVNFNNNRFDIRQAFAEGFDPDRIAVAFASDLGRLGEIQMQSALAPAGGVH